MKRLKKRFAVVCNQINRKKYLILIMVRNIIILIRKLLEQPKITSQQLKNMKTSNNVDIKSVIIQYSKILHKLSKNIRQVEKVSQIGVGKGSNSHSYSERKKNYFFV